jgi:hypothetical protein
MLEIYNENLRDLLVDSRNCGANKLDILATQASGCNVPGATQVGRHRMVALLVCPKQCCCFSQRFCHDNPAMTALRAFACSKSTCAVTFQLATASQHRW